jgi:divalent metal cation (Fe/Co/Zn/Cd) transporter
VITGDGVWDGIGSMTIGVLLGIVAIILAIETKSLLIGEAADPEVERSIRTALESVDEVDHIIDLRTQHLGPDDLLIAAKIAVNHDDTAAQVAKGIDAAEARIRTAVPMAGHIFLEPALGDPTRVAEQDPSVQDSAAPGPTA